ncbi:MAG: copper amine oxidase N-terminal domain-containing protein, partial [Defluviitaleaceae bacterium]|nr:copper amine oxidase N-terminal domain-containing protein [Defluviitaleaceae bacterium]
IEWGRFRPHEHPFFPAGTAVAFMPRHGRTLRHLELIGQIWYEGNISSLGVERFGYEIRLPEVMFGTDQNVRIHPPRFYESIRVGILLPVPEIDDREYPILPTHLRFEIGSKVYIHNGVQKQLNTAPFINEETGHVMLPVLVITEALGYFHDVVHVFDNQYFALVLNRTGDSEFYIRDIDEPRRGINNIVTVNGCLFAALQGVALISSQHEYIRRDGNFIDVWASREDAAVWLEAQN